MIAENLTASTIRCTSYNNLKKSIYYAMCKLTSCRLGTKHRTVDEK